MGPYIDRSVPVQYIELTTGELQSRMINRNRMHLSSILSPIAKGLNTYVNKVFMFFIFNTFVKIDEDIFLFNQF